MRQKNEGEGSIFKQRDMFRAQIYIDGARITKVFETRTDARNWLKEIKGQQVRGLTFNTSKITLAEFAASWMKAHRQAIRESTAKSYQHYVDDYIVPDIGGYKLSELKIDTISDYYDSLEVGARTRKYIHQVLHICLEDATKRGLIPINPTNYVDKPSYEHGEMNILEEDEIMQFLISTKESRNKALYHLAILTGMRQGELLGLMWTDINFKRGTILIQRQLEHGLQSFVAPKTKSGIRTIRILEQTIQILREHKERQNYEKAFFANRWKDFGLVFCTTIGTPMDHSALLAEFKEELKTAMVKKIRFHDLRHTAASHMINTGASITTISRTLGHSKPSITMDIYGHLIATGQDDLTRKMTELVTPVEFEFLKRIPVE